jgi:hypothetical protein
MECTRICHTQADPWRTNRVFDWKDRIDISMHGNQEAKLRAQAEEALAASRTSLLEKIQVSIPETKAKAA